MILFITKLLNPKCVTRFNGRSKGTPGTPPFPRSPNSLTYMGFSAKKSFKIIQLWELAPPPRKILDPQLRLIKNYYSNDDDIKLTNCYFPDKRYQVEDPYKVRHMFYASIRKNKVAVYSHKGVILCFPGSVHKKCPGSLYFCFILYTGSLTDLWLDILHSKSKVLFPLRVRDCDKNKAIEVSATSLFNELDLSTWCHVGLE